MIINSLLLSMALSASTPNISTTTADTLLGHSDNGAEFCYVPTSNNVRYSDVTTLYRERPDHIISYGDDPLQYGELWLPSHSSALAKPPLVIFIHGGCWQNTFDIQHTHAISTGLRHSGYAVWSLEYRRTGDVGGGWPGTFDDIKQGIEHILGRSIPTFNADKVAIVGHSAGGHLALLAGGVFKDNQAIKTVIGLAAITDLAKYAEGTHSCESAALQFMGGKPKHLPQTYRNANPAQQTMHPNTILIHGNADTIVAPKQSTYLTDAHQVMIDDAGHFDMVHPGTYSFQALLKQLAQQL